MANKTPADKGAQGTLQRGKACLRCRKRKMRCDGTKPACQQCTRAKKGDVCEYDDGKGKTRTQILRETIVKLEQRVRELEDPDYVSPVVTLHDPHGHSRSGSSDSSYGSPESSYLSASHSPFLSESPTSPAEPWQLQGVPSPSPSPFIPEILYDDQRGFQPPFELGQMLLDIFTPHRLQCGLGIHIGQLRESLSLPASQQRHPVLMNAIYLWACFVSRPEPLCQHEEHYLRHSLEALPDALQRGDKSMDVIQASCLLSQYFLANGRLIEGSYHASAAAALAVQIGLHGRSSREVYSWSSSEVEGFDQKPPKIDLHDGERILTFWQVYNLDRCWSVVLRKPSVIPDGPTAWNSIYCPWPQVMADYETGHIGGTAVVQTIKSFLDGEVSPDGFSIPASRVKASTLFAHADLVSKTWELGSKASGILEEELRVVEHSINMLLSILIPINQLDAVLPEDKHTLVLAHTLTHCAMIHLHRSFAQDDSLSFEKCSRAARSCVDIIKHISDRDFAFLDPIVGPCWWSVAEILIRELDTLETSWPLMDSSDLRNDIGAILYAMNSLGSRFPIIAPAMAKVQKRLS
ncbi:hypothetical protein BDQ12DRAFT_29250 [Crucibulum laeve]|uniref:Zn(2)-C6 fungal-type domain-containing protein n=1 Tax=Crucibulum laeve TaxID=68775 RepID=A0A5C3MHK9_9AGAR|nr:hypothetical protein BDQ12DRAFT_29250 [Crucibulum laeve]